MTKNSKFKHLLLCLSIFQCLTTQPCEKEVDTTKVALEKAKVSVATAQETIKKIPALLEKVKANAEARKKRRIDGIVNQFKDQNTVLYRLGDLFAVYKSDVVKGACFGLDFLGELLTYREIFKQKVEHVLEMIKEDPENLENLLKQADSAQKANDKRNKIVAFIANRFRTLPEVSALKKYINDKHKMIGYNPFKKDLLPYLGLSLLKTKVLHFIEDSFMAQSTMKDLFNDEILEASRGAYEKDNAGNLKLLDSTPFSITTILMFLLNSRYVLERVDFLSLNHLRMINKFFGLNIPAFVYSDIMKVIISIGSLGLAVKFTDTILNTSWSMYVLKNQEEFLKLVEHYNLANKDNPESVQRVEQDLRKFITAGHAQGMISKLWLNKKESSQMYMKCLFLSPMIGMLGWKAYQQYKASSV